MIKIQKSGAQRIFDHPVLKHLKITIKKSGAQRRFDHPVLKHLMMITIQK